MSALGVMGPLELAVAEGATGDAWVELRCANRTEDVCERGVSLSPEDPFCLLDSSVALPASGCAGSAFRWHK